MSDIKSRTNSWISALNSFCYPFNLYEYELAVGHKGWFNQSSTSGCRDDTIKFEDHFREYAKDEIAPWLEVIFWKMFSTGIDAANSRTKATEKIFFDKGTSASNLFGACNDFINKPTQDNLKRIMIFLKISNRIAIAMTLPALLNPQKIPMIDIRTANWVNNNFSKFNSFDTCGCQLRKQNNCGAPQISDYNFWKSWIDWCNHMACKLSELTEFKWRPRDVEMAVFTADKLKLDLMPL